MSSALNHGKTVLGTIFARQSRGALDYALRFLQPEHFTDNVQRNLWVLAERYLDQAGHVLTRPAVEDILRGQPPGTGLMYLQMYDAVCSVAEPETGAGAAAFKWSVQQLRELAAERMTGEALATAMEILRTGMTEGRNEFHGHEDCRSWLAGEIARIDRQLRFAEAPEGDVRTESAVVLSEYGARKGMALRGESVSVSTGIAELDKLLGGGHERGEFNLIAGNTSAGKTSWIVHLGWHAAVMLGRSVVIFTSETLRPQIRIKILARHSRLERFGLPHGLNSKDIRSGQLTPAAERKLAEVADDFSRIPGRLFVAQVPKGSTISGLDAHLARITREWPADLVIIDSVQLLKGEAAYSRRAGWEESAATLRAAKEMAGGYRDGSGVPVVSPWQVSKEGFRAARERGFHLLDDLSETSEARTTPDVILSLLAPPEFTGGRDVSLEMSLLKNRDGEAKYGAGNTIKLRADYATSYFTAQAGSGDSVSRFMNYQQGEFG